MTMYKKSANSPKSGAATPKIASGPPLTAAGDTRSFDMRPKPSDNRRREDPRDRAIRPTDPAPEKLLDEPAE